MARRAEEVLRRNDMGGWTRPAPKLPPTSGAGMHSTPIAPPGLVRAGELEGAEVLRREALVLLLKGGLAEYFEPFTDEPL
jgi:hypothetical protein